MKLTVESSEMLNNFIDYNFRDGTRDICAIIANTNSVNSHNYRMYYRKEHSVAKYKNTSLSCLFAIVYPIVAHIHAHIRNGHRLHTVVESEPTYLQYSSVAALAPSLPSSKANRMFIPWATLAHIASSARSCRRRAAHVRL